MYVGGGITALPPTAESVSTIGVAAKGMEDKSTTCCCCCAAAAVDVDVDDHDDVV